MKKKGLSSYAVTIGGGVVVFVLVAVFLAGASLPAGARLTAGYLELRQVHTSDVLPGALGSIEEAEGQVVTIARAPGDQITADMLGDAAAVGIGSQLQDGHRAVAVHVDQASGLVGVIRPGSHGGDTGDLAAPAAGRAGRGSRPRSSKKTGWRWC